MGGELIGRNKGTGGYGSKRRAMRSEINVTPFVDVMLVLLIVFMVTAPLMTVGVPVDLPKTKAAAMNDSQEPLVISIDKNGTLFVQETKVSIGKLVPRLKAISNNNPETRIFVRGDKSIPYGQVMQVMGQISAAGFSRVALLSKTPGTGSTQ